MDQRTRTSTSCPHHKSSRRHRKKHLRSISNYFPLHLVLQLHFGGHYKERKTTRISITMVFAVSIAGFHSGIEIKENRNKHESGQCISNSQRTASSVCTPPSFF